jgi:hypothetical protein
MKGIIMKEKLIIGTAVITLIGLIYIDASLKSPETVAETQSSLPIPESVEVVNEEPILDLSEEGSSYAEPASLMNSCEMSEDDTSQLSFSEAFGYFRNCLGADSSFQWKGNFYTTLLESEIVIPIADSIKVEDNDPSTEMSQNP